jgi:hypothetical protein
MEQTHEFDPPAVSTAELWWAILIGPVAWIIDQGLSYSIDQHACSTGKFYLLHIITAASLVLALTGVLVGWRQLRRTPAGANEDGGTPRDRSWFMAWLGILLSLEFVIVVVAMAVPKILLSPCD